MTGKRWILGLLLAVLAAGGCNRSSKPTNALTEAVRAGDTAGTKALLAKGANIHVTVGDGQTLLHVAAAKGHRDIAAVLITGGISVSATDLYGNTPLHVAANKRVAELLITSGAEIAAKDAQGRTPLMRAAGAGNRHTLELLLDRGADPTAARDSDGWTPLHSAAAANRRTVELLLDRGADVNAVRKNGDTPLRVATREDGDDIADTLRAHGAK